LVEKQELRMKLHNLVKTYLTKQEADFVTLRFGLYSRVPLSLLEAGQQMCPPMSKIEAGRMETAALRKLKYVECVNAIRPYIGPQGLVRNRNKVNIQKKREDKAVIHQSSEYLQHKLAYEKQPFMYKSNENKTKRVVPCETKVGGALGGDSKTNIKCVPKIEKPKTQVCIKCDKELPLDNFYFSNRLGRTHTRECKDCSWGGNVNAVSKQKRHYQTAKKELVVKYTCPLCGATGMRSKKGLAAHCKRMHKGMSKEGFESAWKISHSLSLVHKPSQVKEPQEIEGSQKATQAPPGTPLAGVKQQGQKTATKTVKFNQNTEPLDLIKEKVDPKRKKKAGLSRPAQGLLSILQSLYAYFLSIWYFLWQSCLQSSFLKRNKKPYSKKELKTNPEELVKKQRKQVKPATSSEYTTFHDVVVLKICSKSLKVGKIYEQRVVSCPDVYAPFKLIHPDSELSRNSNVGNVGVLVIKNWVVQKWRDKENSKPYV